MGNSLRDLRNKLAVARATDALESLDRGDVRRAYKQAVRALEFKLRVKDRRKLGSVFYAHGKFLTSKGQFGKAAADFSSAVECSEHNETFRNRHRTAMKALRKSSFRIISQDREPITDANLIRRYDVVLFRTEMHGNPNVSLSNLPPPAILHYVRQAGYLCPPPQQVKMPNEDYLDEFRAMGTYRWQGDERSGDQFTRWIRCAKKGDRIVCKHLGRLLADWIWSETDYVKDTDVLVTVPGGPRREAQRGFNPPDILAHEVQDCLGIPLLLRVLEREESSRARELSYHDVRRLFSLGKAARQINGKSVLLIDDVGTRGYTLRTCSELCRNAGAKRVACVVLAQSVSTHRERLARRMHDDDV